MTIQKANVIPALILLATYMTFASAAAFGAPVGVLPEESQIVFVVKEMGVPVAGKFKRFDAAIDIDPANPEKSSANLRIDVGSLTTGNEEADALAVGPDWLDKAHAQYAIFKGSSVSALGGGRYEVKGTLTIRNRARPMVVQLISTERAGGKHVITSEFVIKRSEFGIGGGEWNEGGVVAEEVAVKIQLTLAPAVTKTSSAAMSLTRMAENASGNRSTPRVP